MCARKLLTLAVAFFIVLLLRVVAAQGIANYSPVTDQRLQKPEPHNWLMYRGTYDGWGYSPLDKINATNVKKLVPMWSFSTGVIEGHQAPPIVNDGVMFITTPQNQVFALDAKTGDLLGATSESYRTISSSATRPIAGSASMKTRYILVRSIATCWRSTPRPARWSGTKSSMTTRPGTT